MIQVWCKIVVERGEKGGGKWKRRGQKRIDGKRGDKLAGRRGDVQWAISHSV